MPLVQFGSFLFLFFEFRIEMSIKINKKEEKIRDVMGWKYHPVLKSNNEKRSVLLTSFYLFKHPVNPSIRDGWQNGIRKPRVQTCGTAVVSIPSQLNMENKLRGKSSTYAHDGKF